MSEFDAFRIFREDGDVEGHVVKMTLDGLDSGDVVIENQYSSVNYKDALAPTTSGRIIRDFPRVGGIDLAGTVISSADSTFAEGDDVLVTGYGLGVTHDGGYAKYARVPSEWVVPMPQGLTPFDVMAIGTAGFTAGLSIMEMEHNGLSPGHGPVIVTGATGGVGSVAVELLAGLGYEVTALTGKDDEHDNLRALGATEVLSRHELETGGRPLEKAIWAGAVDAVGGKVLEWLTRTMRYRGCIASSGLTAGIELDTTVLPFILRGVRLLGIDSVMCPMDLRRRVWHRLATDMKPTRLPTVARTIGLAGLPGAFATLLAGEARGRTVVRIS
jgi:NADPH2:quinone reductase